MQGSILREESQLHTNLALIFLHTIETFIKVDIVYTAAFVSCAINGDSVTK
jgi:hypothetical protein